MSPNTHRSRVSMVGAGSDDGLSTFSAVVMNVNMVIGAGVVGLPYAFYHAGAWLSIAALLAATLMASATMGYLVEVLALSLSLLLCSLSSSPSFLPASFPPSSPDPLVLGAGYGMVRAATGGIILSIVLCARSRTFQRFSLSSSRARRFQEDEKIAAAAVTDEEEAETAEEREREGEADAGEETRESGEGWGKGLPAGEVGTVCAVRCVVGTEPALLSRCLHGVFCSQRLCDARYCHPKYCVRQRMRYAVLPYGMLRLGYVLCGTVIA